MKLSFKNDYSEGCHPSILHALATSNLEQHDGYGLDAFSENASKLILKQMGNYTADIHFVAGGTQANLLVISSILKPFESVISVETGHIAEHEAGAIEATGHKINTVVGENGKLTVPAIETVLSQHQIVPHQVKPKLVYISNSTELGTIYTHAELKALSDYCRAHDLYLYMDGARLGQALVAKENDLSLNDISVFTDAFYIGGTKNGALLGEAIVITNKELQNGFDFVMKQRGALLSKGRLLGIQFETLFQENLYFQLATHANHQAMKIKQALKEKGILFWVETTTNQLFPILTQSQIETLECLFQFYIWQKLNENESVIRLITSWATPEEHTHALIDAIHQL